MSSDIVEGTIPKKIGGTRIWSKAEPRICVWCNKVFIPHQYNQISCSKECRQNWYIQIHQKERSENSKRWERQNRSRSRSTSKIYRDRIRLEAIKKLTNSEIRCVKCGFSDIRALAIDHIKGGGHKERINGHGMVKTISDIVLRLSNEEAQEKYQILCYNYNRIKQVEKEEIHKPVLLEDELN